MPKIFEYFGFVFFFYSNEHEPIHVIRGECQSVFELIWNNGELDTIVKRTTKGYPSFIKVYSKQIIQKWIDYFVMKKQVQCTEIKTRI